MNLSQLKYFVTLARLEHYTKAAEELEISQPSLSYAMTMLEQELGTKLFQKKGRNIVLTKYGKFFLDYVEQSLQDKKYDRADEGTYRSGIHLYSGERVCPKDRGGFSSEP